MINEPGAVQGEVPPRNAKWSWGEKPPQLYTLCALAFFVTPVGLLVPEKLTLLLVIVAGLTLLTNPVSGAGPIKRQSYIYALCTLLVWAGFTLLWGDAPHRAAVDHLLKLILLSALGILLVTYARELRQQDKILLGRWLVPSLWAFLALILADRVTGNSLTGLLGSTFGATQAGMALLLLSWPAGGMLFHAGRPVQALLLLTGAGLVQAGLGAQEVILAWVIGGMTAALAAVLPRVAAIVLGAGFAVSILAAPFLAAQPGLLQRLVPGAKDMATLIKDHPLFGVGFWSFDIPMDHAPRDITGSAVLQIWLELGLVGAVILCVLCGLLASACRHGPSAARAMRTGLLATGFLFCGISIGAWQTWWVAALFIAATVAAAIPDRPPQNR